MCGVIITQDTVSVTKQQKKTTYLYLQYNIKYIHHTGFRKIHTFTKWSIRIKKIKLNVNQNNEIPPVVYWLMSTNYKTAASFYPSKM